MEVAVVKKYLTEDFLILLLSILLFGVGFLFTSDSDFRYILFIISYSIISSKIYIQAFRNIIHGKVFDENFLMIIATLGAFMIGSFMEAVMVMILFQVGEYLSYLATSKTKESITRLMDLRSSFVHLIDGNKTKKTAISKVKVGDVFVVKPGEKIPLDGVVIEGESSLDTASLTGEAKPKVVGVSDTVLSGVINLQSVIKVRSTSVYATSTTSKIVHLIEQAEEKKSKTETFIQKFCKVYTPLVVVCALILVFVPTLLGYSFQTWLYRGLVFLVTACPCALIISVPLGYFCGIGRASKEGVLVKGSNELDVLKNIDFILFDKTGTLTKGVFTVQKIVTAEIDEEEFLQYVRAAEESSIHPIAEVIRKSFPLNSRFKVSKYQEIRGKGITCSVRGKTVAIGSYAFMKELQIEVPKVLEAGTIFYVAIASQYAGYMVISDEIKESSYKLNEMRQLGVSELVIVSGDNKTVVKETAKKLGISSYYAELLPTDKVNKVKRYKKKGNVMFVGDGINDAPVLTVADIGVSMGGIGSDAAIEASDVVLMRDDLSKLTEAIRISRATRKLVISSISFALVVKFLVLLFAVVGFSTMWMAVLADVGVTLLSILNVIRIMWKKL